MTYTTNTQLYQDPALVEGEDYGRRYRRQELFDGDLTGRGGVVRSTVLALHGGGIETGTSELCLAIAGYHPATLEVTPPGAVTHDYWMFEGLRAKDNDELHVTATGCDDGVALSLCAGALNALSLHGFNPASAQLPENEELTLVGGRNAILKGFLLEELNDDRGLCAIDAAPFRNLNGNSLRNIANRTFLKMGGHLELTTPLRLAMFEVNAREQRKHTTTPVFWAFVAACRAALARLEAEQVVR